MKRTIVVLALLASGCTLPSRPSDSTANDVVNSLAYRLDKRTNVCFAIVASWPDGDYKVISIAAVPREACGR